jgi:hypothetical protein
MFLETFLHEKQFTKKLNSTESESFVHRLYRPFIDRLAALSVICLS